ncbi:hypothetical protein Micbo1qcDRAFT_171828 [Microdochium bolleyi]|uniref:non-specific serine/threonine protein kinase n=1 Tax=Microdochium bolleyi TaxID=196109 RepID=A0A136JEB9_9PEZI|nr:hypothetical protein Micbo1qcDRAFT_171828 [Microdochium bolleyi]
MKRDLSGTGSLLSLVINERQQAGTPSVASVHIPREPVSCPSPTPSRDTLYDIRQVTQKLSLPGLTKALTSSKTVIHRTDTTLVVESTSQDNAMPAPSVNDTNTPPTSVDSKSSSYERASSDRRSASVIHVESSRSKLLHVPLAAIEETAFDPSIPTVVTVERAAAAKCYLETYFNALFSNFTPRAIRLQCLEAELYYTKGLTNEDRDIRRKMFFRSESDHLRRTRVLKTREVLKVLGKGSFGVVRLVRHQKEHHEGETTMGPSQSVYAMKVIRKSEMLRSTQEGHLRAERDFLVASEGSKWIVPLVASFEDLKNLYLVIEYMPGGDFLGLLIRENILGEPATKFYIAEMILCIEEAHALGCIHRDIKPENFLITASGHLKISDFGLAFDGHWSHETTYYHAHRYSLLHKLGITVDGDSQDRMEAGNGMIAKGAHVLTAAIQKHDWRMALSRRSDSTRLPEPLLGWRNRCGNRSAAKSCVGTNGSRQATKHRIVCHKQTFAFPQHPFVSRRAHDLITNLICDQEERISSSRYRQSEPSACKLQLRGRPLHRKPARHIVFPNDAEEIKAHKWFRDVPWDRLQQLTPPWVPCISNVCDTRYFDDEDSVSDWSESVCSRSSASETADGISPRAGLQRNDTFDTCLSKPSSISKSQRKTAALHAELRDLPRHLRSGLMDFISSPYDSHRLKRMDREIEALIRNSDTRDRIKGFVRKFGRRERKRPRDKLLRDGKMKNAVLLVRRQTAFAGYSYLRK